MLRIIIETASGGWVVTEYNGPTEQTKFVATTVDEVNEIIKKILKK